MNRILRGIMRYRETVRENMVEQFERVKDNPVPKAVFFTCMDSRMIPTRFTDTCIGDMFVVRNPGNLIVNSHFFQGEMNTCEPAALELACVVNDVRHIIVCGHSDCKAMNLLYQFKDPKLSDSQNRLISPLRSWLFTHGATSLNRLLEWEQHNFTKPLIFSSESKLRTFIAYIDPKNQFCIEDKLSQINTLQQLSNMASYGFLRERLEQQDLHLHALWFDIYTGDVYYFSRLSKQYVIVDEQSISKLLREVETYYT